MKYPIYTYSLLYGTYTAVTVQLYTTQVKVWDLEQRPTARERKYLMDYKSR